VGASGPVVPADGVGAAHAEARRTVDALVALGTPGRGAAAVDLGFAGLVVSGAPDVNRYVVQQLGPVVEYDERRGTDLVQTLDAYFDSAASPRHAAEALHVHVNTIAQRLERLRALLGDDWQQPDRTLELQLALRLRRIIGG
jgi:DNA-binding PucR family transcriptional regulator